MVSVLHYINTLFPVTEVVSVQYCNPGKDLAQPFAKCFSIWFAGTVLRVYASLFMIDMGL